MKGSMDMKKIYKHLSIFTTIFALVAGLIYVKIGNKIPTTSINNEPTSVVNNVLTSNKTTNSSNVIIYTSQPYESYSNGEKVADIGNLLNTKLTAKGINSNFISNIITKEYPESNNKYINYYDVTRKFIIQNVKDYNSSILLNICRNELPNQNIVIALAKTNPHYVENKKFANSLVEQFNKLGQTVSVTYYNASKNYLNQDLSNQSILISIGNDQSSDSELNKIVNTIATALQNVQENNSI